MRIRDNNSVFRVIGLIVGVVTHLLFVVTVWQLFFFLKDGRPTRDHGSLVIDALLALGFAAPHSAILHPRVKRFLGQIISPGFYGLFYCAVTCGTLLALFYFWQGVGPVVWKTQGLSRDVISLGFYASWVALFYSLHLTGLGYQTGLTPWLSWVRGEPVPRRGFTPRGVYQWMRHPVYLSFLGLVWFTPKMTADHAVLTGVWTIYLFIGSWLKDERLALYLGNSYREYQQRVPGYPGIPYGPLARHSADLPVPSEVSQPLRRAA